MFHGAKITRHRNGRINTTSVSGSSILAKARREREQREQQKTQIKACVRIQSTIRLLLFKRKMYADFLEGESIPEMYTEIVETEGQRVIPFSMTRDWLFYMESRNEFELLRRVTRNSKITARFFFCNMKEWMDTNNSSISPECTLKMITILLDGIDNDPELFHTSLHYYLVKFEAISKSQAPGKIYNECDSFLFDLISLIKDLPTGKLVIKRLLETVITLTYALFAMVIHSSLDSLLVDVEFCEFKIPTRAQIELLSDFPISKYKLVPGVEGFFSFFFLCFKNYAEIYSILIEYFIESSTLQQMHDYVVAFGSKTPVALTGETSVKPLFKQMIIFVLSLLKIKHDDLRYMWLVYHIYQRYDCFIGNFPYQIIANPILNIGNAENIYKTLPTIVEIDSLGKNHFQALFIYFYMKTSYDGYALIENIFEKYYSNSYIVIPTEKLYMKTCLYIYSRIPANASSKIVLDFSISAVQKNPDFLEDFNYENYEDHMNSWKSDVFAGYDSFLKTNGFYNSPLEITLDTENFETSIIKSMISIQHTNFDVRYKDEIGRGDGLRKQYMSDALKLFFFKSNMFEIDFQKGELWPSRKFFDTRLGDIFQDSSAQLFNHKSLIGLAGKTLALFMLQDLQCPFKFSKAFLMKFIARVFWRRNELGTMDAGDNRMDTLEFADLKLKDEDLHEQLLHLTRLSSEEIKSMGLFMEYKDCNFGSQQGMPIEKENLHLYIESVVNYEMNDSKIEMFMKYFIRGFIKILPETDALSLAQFAKYNCEYLSKLISANGKEEFSTETFIKNLTLQGYEETDTTIQHLYEILRNDMNDEERWSFFEFFTSMAMLPSGGIGALKPGVCISKAQDYRAGMNLYPVASTCVNMLILPDYQNKQELLDKIRYVVKNEHRFHLD
ncbi:hypothetical protein ACO0OL_000345 [Hanseniaspora opuntiae]